MKAFALLSGGLDSLLAAQLIHLQGIEVIALHFNIPFYSSKKSNKESAPAFVSQAVSHLGISLRTVDISEDFLNILLKPKFGYGSNINPCIDCKILMFRKAKELMGPEGVSFVVSGEVLGQRPMSQHRKALESIDEESGLQGLIIRPLSGLLFPETIPEQKGWVTRSRLLGFNGRGRRPQMDLAAEFGIKQYANPAGGCLLTDPLFKKRVEDLIKHNEVNLRNVALLKVGRHFRLSAQSKLVVGRDESENDELVKLSQESDYCFMPSLTAAGATALGIGMFNDELVRFSCSINARYCDLNGAKTARILYRKGVQGNFSAGEVSPLEERELQALRI
ncbi:MAG: tRNA 4-thiouridine(8) synthase ThiI [Candidatus Omnitrophota bacterium]|jgi:hypothetical protein